MTVKIRLARAGAKKRPYYKVVVASSNAPRDGKFLEKVGVYNPMLQKSDKNRVIISHERVKYWIAVGAKATETVNRLLKKLALIQNNNRSSVKEDKKPNIT